MPGFSLADQTDETSTPRNRDPGDLVPVWHFGQPALARPPHKKALADYLGLGLAGKLNDCRTCHLPAEEGADALDARPHNPFGKRLKAVRSELKKAGKPSGIPARVEAVADEDSDGDGISNLLELVTGHFPGEADDRPSPESWPKAARPSPL